MSGGVAQNGGVRNAMAKRAWCGNLLRQAGTGTGSSRCGNLRIRKEQSGIENK